MEPNSAVMVFPLARVKPDYDCKKGVITSWEHTLKSFQKHFGKKFDVYGIHTDCENIHDESCDKTRTIVYYPTECFPDSTEAHIKFQFDTSQFNNSKEQKLYQVRSVSVIYQIILFVLDHILLYHCVVASSATCQSIVCPMLRRLGMTSCFI